MNYFEFTFTVSPLQPASEILVAELGMAGFESFVEHEEGIRAYIPKAEFRPGCLEDIQILKSTEFDISYTSQEIEQVNWNEEWEKNFHPIVVDDTCSVRAPFHEKKDTRYDIVIEPKMSFGTGHHATTHMMIQYLLKEDLTGKEVLDMGCGTGVLAIVAELRGAERVEAIDIDNWCYLNTLENVERNNCKRISVFEGGAELLNGKTFDTIIANINRNILLQDMARYSRSLHRGGDLFLSGFYEEDIPILREECERHGLSYVDHIERDKWIAMRLLRKEN